MKKSVFQKTSLVATVLLLASFHLSAQMNAKDGSEMKKSKYSYSETLDLLKGAIEEQNLMVIADIDGQKMMRMAGKQTKGMRQIFYFHPKYMRRVIEANQAASIQIPLKLLVMEKPDNTVVVRFLKPSTVLNEYAGEEEIAKELDGLLENILNEIAN